NTASGGEALRNNTTGYNNTAIGSNADVSSGGLINATAIGAYAVVNASNKIRLGDANVTVIEGQVAYTYTSDRNQKENFQSVDGDDVLRKIRQLSLTSWNYIGDDRKQSRHYGPVAQEFFATFGDDGVG
ncbi:MAG: tail fiber domain-containing protein, partial [Candidatus Zixiibacteriota bacterium]